MSLAGNQVRDRKVAANRSNAEKSTGPKTKTGASLNPFKYAVYANRDSRHPEIMVRRSEERSAHRASVCGSRLVRSYQHGGRGGLRRRGERRKIDQKGRTNPLNSLESWSRLMERTHTNPKLSQ
jgi:hypothetical protein